MQIVSLTNFFGGLRAKFVNFVQVYYVIQVIRPRKSLNGSVYFVTPKTQKGAFFWCQMNDFRPDEPCLSGARGSLIPGNGQFLASAGLRN